jgi:hypothetical protein
MATINSGMVLRCFPRVNLNFSNLAANGTQGLVLATHIDTTTFTECDLIVRYHSGTTISGSTGAQLLISVLPEGYDFDDPASSFNSNTSPVFGASYTVSVTTATSYPYYGVAQATSPFGRFVMVGAWAQMGSTTGTLNAFVSADLVLKGGDPSGLPTAPNSFRGYLIM